MNSLVFFETRRDVGSFDRRPALRQKTDLCIALTSEAAQALDEKNIAYAAASQYAKLSHLRDLQDEFNRRTLQIAHDLETFIATHYPKAQFDDPAFISDFGYCLQATLTSIATRITLVCETIKILQPKSVSFYKQPLEPWLTDQGFTENPWEEPIRRWIQTMAIPWIELRPDSIEPQARSEDPRSSLKNSVSSLLRGTATEMSQWLHSPRKKTMNLLFLGGVRYDWNWVIPELHNARISQLETQPLKRFYWIFSSLNPSIKSLSGRTIKTLSVPGLIFEENEKQAILNLFSKWELESKPTLYFDDLQIDLFPALSPGYQTMAVVGPALARHTDAVAQALLKDQRPDVVCTVALADFVSRRFSTICRTQSLPVVCYQHGGVYGTHVSRGLDQTIPAYADYFLTYGAGIQPPPHPLLATNARYISVGSSKLDAVRTPTTSNYHRKPFSPFKILWLSDISTANTTGGCTQTEEVLRYQIEKECLECLSQDKSIEVTYRYFEKDVIRNGIPAFLKTHPLPTVRLSYSGLALPQIQKSDLVIIMTHSNTSWNEVLALQKPLIVYCDPCYTPLVPHFATDLESSCCWCKSKEDFLNVMHHLTQKRDAWMETFKTFNSAPYLEKYVLDRNQGENAKRVAAIIKRLSAKETVEPVLTAC